MAQQYQPRRFFRQAPNRLLKQCLGHHLDEVDFDELSETEVEPIYKAWIKLPKEIRNKTEQDFQKIDDLATESGLKAILDEARWHGEDLAEQFAQLQGYHEHAFWTYLERPSYWNGALAFHHADRIPTSFWRKRKNLPRRDAAVDTASIQRFEQDLGLYFHSQQGRGQNCKIDTYRRNDLDYFFAYPEDYAQASVEWDNGAFQRRSHRPAFEIIFVYSKTDGTLDIFLAGNRKSIPDLQAHFAQTILGEELGPDNKDERVYDLNQLMSRQFQFIYNPVSGISKVAIKKLRLKILGRDERITLEADSSVDEHAVHDLLDKVAQTIPPSRAVVTQVGIKVTFSFNPHSRRVPTRTFSVSWPNSCSLKHGGRDSVIRKMLADSGIEPQEPPKG